MWPDDEEYEDAVDLGEQEGEDEEAIDDEALTTRLEAAYRQERAKISSATAVDDLRDLRDLYAEQVAERVLVGVAGVRAGDLIDLIEIRLGELEAERLTRQAHHDEEVDRLRAELAARDQRDREAAARRQAADRVRRDQQERERDRQQRVAAEKKAQERARQAEAEQRAASARLANAKAAEIEARAALLRAQAARAVRAPAARATGARPAPRSPASELERVVTDPVPTESDSALSPMEKADQDALMSAGHWPPNAPPRDSPLWTRDAGWPRDWTLKGFDLASLRGRLGVTQAVMAGQLGVPTIEVSRAEADPREKVRPALQMALKRAIDEFVAANVTRAAPTSSPARAEAVPVPAPMISAPTPLTGADLSQFRRARQLSQRQAAEILEVAHGTVAKAELSPAQSLGERLQRGLARALDGGS